MSCIGTVIQNYFKIFNASYTPSVILYGFIYNLPIVASETRHVLLQNRACRILSKPPGKVFYCWCARNNVMMTPTHRILYCQTRLQKVCMFSEVVAFINTIFELFGNVNVINRRLSLKRNLYTRSLVRLIWKPAFEPGLTC